MVTLDAYAVIAFLRGDAPAAEEVAELLRSPTSLSAANYAEVVDHIMRHGGLDADEAEVHMRLLVEAGMTVVAVDDQLAGIAGSLRAEHYERKSCAISLADCCALAVALMTATPLVTVDQALAATAREVGATVIALPDSRGVRP